ncbi:unnamed protein product [Dicrocoelium dendriticum]|nr:unnamed protein product [Dicrocoelium dendriticum]
MRMRQRPMTLRRSLKAEVSNCRTQSVVTVAGQPVKRPSARRKRVTASAATSGIGTVSGQPVQKSIMVTRSTISLDGARVFTMSGWTWASRAETDGKQLSGAETCR